MVKDVGVYCRLIIQSIIIVITTQHTAEENLGQKRAGSNQVFNFKRAADWPKVKPESSRIMLAQEVKSWHLVAVELNKFFFVLCWKFCMQLADAVS